MHLLTSCRPARVCLFAAFQELQTGLEQASHCVELSGSTAVVALLQVLHRFCSHAITSTRDMIAPVQL